jgi:hypothetical protein
MWWLISLVTATQYTIPGYYGSKYLDFDSSSPGAESLYWSHQYTLDDRGYIYLADIPSHTIKRVLARDLVTGVSVVERLVGSPGVEGNRLGEAALLSKPHSTALQIKFDNSTGLEEKQRFILIADTGNHCIKSLDLSIGVVSELVGKCEVSGFKDGPQGVNRLNSPQLVGVSASGNIYIMDSGNRYVRMFYAANETLVTLTQGACQHIHDPDETVPKLPYAIDLAQNDRTKRLRIQTVVCLSDWVKTSGEPSEHLYLGPEDQCLRHYILCGNRTNPLVS